MTSVFAVACAPLTLLALSVALWLGPWAGFLTLAGGVVLCLVAGAAWMIWDMWEEE